MENIVNELQGPFRQHRNAGKAISMSRYMRNQFRFFGIPGPVRSSISKTYLQYFTHINAKDLSACIQILWEMPEREYQYFCLDAVIKAKKQWHPDLIEDIEYMITHKSWWDTVDTLAGSIVGKFMLRYPEKKEPTINRWRNAENIWLIRTALLFQLKYKDQTDQPLLFSLVEQHAGHEDFFIRKAIGWALREYAKTRPDEAIRFIQTTPLSPLSRREALKYFPEERAKH